MDSNHLPSKVCKNKGIMKTYGVRRLTHRDIQRQYFAVTENGVDVAFTDTPEKAERLMLALRLLSESGALEQDGALQWLQPA